MAKEINTIGVLTSGGDAPGMNAAIRAVVRQALSKGKKVKGIKRGYAGLLNEEIVDMDSKSVSDTISRGGTILQTARCKEFVTAEGQQKGAEICKKHGIDAIVVIGGDGSFQGAQKLAALGINTIGLPGTIDLDIACTDYTIGFDTACNTAMEAIDKVRDTSTSHERCSIIEVMGREAGDIALWSGVAGGAEDVIIPEHDFDVKKIASKLQSSRERGQKHAVILLAEGVMHADQFAKELAAYGDFQLHATVLGHIVRGGAPSARDRVLASQMGAYAVELLLQGKGALAVGIENNKITAHDVRTLFDAKHHAELSLYTLAEELTF